MFFYWAWFWCNKEGTVDVVCPISITLFFLVLLLLLTQSLDMIDDEVSYLRGVWCLVWFELAFFSLQHYKNTVWGRKDRTSLRLSKRCSWIQRLSPLQGPSFISRSHQLACFILSCIRFILSCIRCLPLSLHPPLFSTLQVTLQGNSCLSSEPYHDFIFSQLSGSRYSPASAQITGIVDNRQSLKFTMSLLLNNATY